jgi:hypothetical protein
MRWGIFWRTLQFDILKVGDIIKAAMLLHNFIVDEREAKGFREEDATFLYPLTCNSINMGKCTLLS